MFNNTTPVSCVYAVANHFSPMSTFINDASIPIKILAYIPCVISHGIDVGYKAFLFAVYTIVTIGSVLAVACTLGNKDVTNFSKYSFYLLVDVSLGIGTSLIGCVLGPVAYKIEDWVIANITEKLIPGSAKAINQTKIVRKEAYQWVPSEKWRNSFT